MKTVKSGKIHQQKMQSYTSFYSCILVKTPTSEYGFDLSYKKVEAYFEFRILEVPHF